MKLRTRIATAVAAAVFVGTALAGVIVAAASPVRGAPPAVTYAAPAGTQADADTVKAFCGQFVERIADAAIVASTNGIPRSAWTVKNGPDYVVDALNVLIDALYAGDYAAAVAPYHAAVAACVKYKTTTDA